MPRRPRSSRPRRSRRSTAGPVFTAVLLAFALFCQAGLSTLHSLSHAAPGHLAAAPALHHHDDAAGGHDHHRHQASRHDRQAAHDHEPGPARRHPARHDEGSSCDLCALIAVGKLGWAAPAPIELAVSNVVTGLCVDTPASRTLTPSLTSAAPRGPPASA